MSAYVAAGFAGLGTGAVYALLAIGLVVTYRGSGVINLAHGALAGWSAYVFYDLRANGRYPLVVPGPWRNVTFGAGQRPTFVTALLITLVTAVVIGLVIHALVYRPLRASPALAKVVASVGVMLYLQSMITVRFESGTALLPKVLPGGTFHLTDRILLAHDALWLLIGAGLLAAGLTAASRRTRVGLATLAASESEKGAVLLGYDPERLGAVSWVMASVLAGVVGVLAAPLFELSPLLFTQLLVPALGAGLVARFASIPAAAVAAVAIGAGQAMLSPLQQDVGWLPRVGLRDGAVFVTIVVAMVLVGKRLPTRGTVERGRLAAVAPATHRTRSPVIVAGATIIGFVVLPSEWGSALLTSVIFTSLALSLVVLTGYVGQTSLAQAAIAGIAGFALSRLTERFGVPFPLAPLLAALVATAFGVLVGVPALRVRGVNLAIVTLAGGIALSELLFKNPSFVGDVRTGGAKVRPPHLGPLDLGLQTAGDPYRPHFGVFVTVVVALLALAVANLRRAATGRAMLAVRGNENAAAAAGVNVAATKLMAFGVSSFIAGVGGTLLAYRFGSISDASFGLFASLTLLAFAYVGGITSVAGALVAGAVCAGGIGFKAMDSLWAHAGVRFGRWELVVGAVGLVVTAVKNPDGLAATGALVLRRRTARAGADTVPVRRLGSTR